jgi:BCD family chlorophyll transporter-like MFS transporter
MAFGMADILLEPYGGQILKLSVASTTKLTAIVAFGTLIGFALASRVLSRGTDPLKLAMLGALCGVPALAAVIASAPVGSAELFVAGVCVFGFGVGLFGHGTLTATMNLAPREQVGLALGAWGAIQATAAGVALALSSVLRDVITGLARNSDLPAGLDGPVIGYTAVYALEVVLLLATVVALWPLLRSRATAAN